MIKLVAMDTEPLPGFVISAGQVLVQQQPTVPRNGVTFTPGTVSTTIPMGGDLEAITETLPLLGKDRSPAQVMYMTEVARDVQTQHGETLVGMLFYNIENTDNPLGYLYLVHRIAKNIGSDYISWLESGLVHSVSVALEKADLGIRVRIGQQVLLWEDLFSSENVVTPLKQKILELHNATQQANDSGQESVRQPSSSDAS